MSDVKPMAQATEIPARSRAAQPRQEVERTERRRRQDTGIGRLDRLTVPGRKDSDKYFYRWVVDQPGRVQLLTQQDDYDVVTYGDLGATPTEKDANEGSPVARVGDKATGQRMILLKKRRDWYESDKAKEQGLIDKRLEGMKRGDVGDPRGITNGNTQTYGEVSIGVPERDASDGRRRNTS